MSDDKSNHGDIDVPDEHAILPKADYGDGRHALLKEAGLFRSPQAIELARRATATALTFFSSSRNPIIVSDHTWLEPHLAYLADAYSSQALYAKLPTAADYRTYTAKIRKSAQNLKDQLTVDREKL